MWRLHRVHHLDSDPDVTSTVRFHPLEFFVNPFVGVPVVVASGLTPWVLVFYELLDIRITLFSHSTTTAARARSAACFARSWSRNSTARAARSVTWRAGS